MSNGTLYLLHWDPPLVGGQQPQHYLGWTNRPVEARVLDHLNDGRADESRLKKGKHGFPEALPVLPSL